MAFRRVSCCIRFSAAVALSTIGCVRADGAARSASAPEPAPAPAHPSPSAVDARRQGHQLLDIDPGARPYRVLVPPVYVAEHEEYVSRVRICVTESGEVDTVEITRPSIPAVDEQLPDVISRWHYRPYLVAGQATAFCYPLSYRVH